MGIGYFKIGIKLEQYAPIFYLFVYLFTYLFIYLSIYLFICLFIYLFILFCFVLFCFGGLHERQIGNYELITLSNISNRNRKNKNEKNKKRTCTQSHEKYVSFSSGPA